LRAVQKDQREGHEKRGKRDEQFEETRHEPRAGKWLEEQQRGQRHTEQRSQTRTREQDPQRRADHAARFRIAEEVAVSLETESAVRAGQAQQHEPHQRIDHQRPQHHHGEEQQMPLSRAFAAAHRGRVRCEGGGAPRVAERVRAIRG
jgi:hypothetical protein